jgi:hypothetical protein
MAPELGKQRRRNLILRVGIGVLLLVAIAYPVFTFKGIPSALFYRRQERQLCIRCGRQELEESCMALDGAVKRRSKMLLQPRIENIDAEHCDHWFLPTASKEGFFEIRRFRWVKGGFGQMEGDLLFQESALIRAFASLATAEVGRASDLFMELKLRKDLRDDLAAFIQSQKASPEQIKDFLQEGYYRRRKSGVVITN